MEYIQNQLPQSELHLIIEELYGAKALKEYIEESAAKNKAQTGEHFAQEAYKASVERKKYERIEKENIDKLKALSAGKTTEWGEFIFVKTMRAGSINYAAIPELMHVSLEEYRKAEVEAWSLTKK